MPVIQNSVSIAANTVVDNVIAGSQFEFLPWHAKVDFGLCQSATGLVLDVYSGQDTLAEQMGPNIRTAAPVNPDDFTLTDVAAAGERLKVRARNTTGGALTLYYTIILTPLV